VSCKCGAPHPVGIYIYIWPTGVGLVSARATKGAGVGERLLCRRRRPNPPQMPLLQIVEGPTT
jgi:hypothetical protein